MDASSTTSVSSKTTSRLRGKRGGAATNDTSSTSSSAALLSLVPSTTSATNVSAANGSSSTDVTLRKPTKTKTVVRVQTGVPADILNNGDLNRDIADTLPANYNFEIHKTIWRLRVTKSRMVALQFPEGLLLYACIISDILERYAGVSTLIMGDVTYGACCVDDYTARALGCDFMVHYGHSCLVPIDVSQINMLYVFVDITIDLDHFIQSVIANFKPTDRLVLAGTIQFATAMQSAYKALKAHFPVLLMPQAKPLSRGEVLGCTSPKFEAHDALIFLADGRFHLESIMIHNPHIPNFYKYDPYNKRLTLEKYGYEEMHALRKKAIATAGAAKKWGLILGTLGRQGNPNILRRLELLLEQRNIPFVTVLLSEIFPAKLSMFADVEAWVQVACPRLSIDWGYAFERPLLSSYEAEVALKEAEWQSVYPMDYYAKDGGKWANYSHDTKQDSKRKPIVVDLETQTATTTPTAVATPATTSAPTTATPAAVATASTSASST